MPVSQAFAGAVLCVAFLPYGPFLCAGAVDKSTKVGLALEGRISCASDPSAAAHMCTRHRASIYALVHPFTALPRAQVFHVLTGEIQFSLSAHSLAVRRMSISADGIIATASDDKEVNRKHQTVQR